VLLVFGADPASELEGAAESLKKLDFLMVADTQHTLTTELATVVLPEASPFEKEGTFVNEGGRLQKLTPATSPRGESRSAWQTAARLIGALGAVQRFDSAAKVFDAMAREVPALKGLSLSMLPVAGVEIHPPSAATGDAGQAEKTGSEKAD